jgi:hypothetical protein
MLVVRVFTSFLFGIYRCGFVAVLLTHKIVVYGQACRIVNCRPFRGGDSFAIVRVPLHQFKFAFAIQNPACSYWNDAPLLTLRISIVLVKMFVHLAIRFS